MGKFNSFPRTDRVVTDIFGANTPKNLRARLNDRLIPKGFVPIKAEEPLYHVLGRVERFLEEHHLPENYTNGGEI